MPKPQPPAVPPTGIVSYLEGLWDVSVSRVLALRLTLEVYHPNKGGYRPVPGAVWSGRWHGTGGQPAAQKLWEGIARVWWRWFPPAALRINGALVQDPAEIEATLDGWDRALAPVYVQRAMEAADNFEARSPAHAAAIRLVVKRYLQMLQMREAAGRQEGELLTQIRDVLADAHGLIGGTTGRTTGAIRRVLAELERLMAAPPPVHDCEAWRREGMGCAQCGGLTATAAAEPPQAPECGAVLTAPSGHVYRCSLTKGHCGRCFCKAPGAEISWEHTRPEPPAPQTGERPPIEPGDWVQIGSRFGVRRLVTSVTGEYASVLGRIHAIHVSEVEEIRKPNGLVWRRAAPDKE